MANMSYCRFQNTLKDLQDCNRAGFTHTESIEEIKQRELSVAREVLVAVFLQQA